MPIVKNALGRHATTYLLGIESSFGVKAASFVDLPFYTSGLQEVRNRQEDPVLGVASSNYRDTRELTEGLPDVHAPSWISHAPSPLPKLPHGSYGSPSGFATSPSLKASL